MSSLEHIAKSLQVLANLLLLYAALVVFGMQYMLYDPPTDSQVEQVFNKFLLAVIETMLAMILVGQNISGCFLLMFTVFLAGKWWALFGEARTQRQEEYPLRASILLYARFWMATLISLTLDICMVIYTAQATLQPNLQPAMTALFLFEFAILAISSLSTTARLALCTMAIVNIRHSTRMDQRRSPFEHSVSTEVRTATAAPASSCAQNEVSTNLPEMTGIQAMEETMQSWREYRRWRTYLELVTGELVDPLALRSPHLLIVLVTQDLMKILTYLYYIAIHHTSHGIPAQFLCEILWILEGRTEKVQEFVRFERTMQQVNKHLTDPANDRIAEHELCMICCGKMEQQDHPSNTRSAGFSSRWRARMHINTRATSEDRPKMLRCGHILHFGCLKEWIGRQNTCPICRKSVQGD